MADLHVVKSEVDGWDVVNAEDGVAVTNHPTREAAEEAARMRAPEDSISEEGEGDVVVDIEHTHGIDDDQRGVKAAFLSLGGLLVAVVLIAVTLALIATLTNFGS
jgi:Uncharacterized protein conserved in bacteria (DUF2188)